MSKRIIIFGSSRSDGNTATIVQYMQEQLQCPVINLNDQQIAPFSYEDDYPTGDTYIQLMEQLVHYDEWICLTPVYWYSMSSQMKTFFDRLSDIVRYRKDLWEVLKGKGMWAMSCGSDGEPTPHFFTPFKLSAEYLFMQYLGDRHLWGGRVTDLKPEVKDIVDEWIGQLDK